MLTTYTSTCSSPVMTVPPSLPPESAVPLVEFEMLPAFGLVGDGVGVLGGESVEGLPDPPRSRAEASLASACALKASTYTARMASATATTFVVTENVLVILYLYLSTNAVNRALGRPFFFPGEGSPEGGTSAKSSVPTPRKNLREPKTETKLDANAN